MEFVLFLIFMFALGYFGKKSKKNQMDIFEWQQTNDMYDHYSSNICDVNNRLSPLHPGNSDFDL